MEDGFKSKGSGTEGATGPLDRDALCRLLSSISTLDMISSLQSNAIVADRQSSSRREKESIAMK
jgi:hypothetical protein